FPEIMMTGNSLTASAALVVALSFAGASHLPKDIADVAALVTAAPAATSACDWAPEFPGPLDVTFYVTSDSEIGRGRPVSEYLRYPRGLVRFRRAPPPGPGGFRGAGSLISPPPGIVPTGDNILGGPGDEGPFIWLIQRLRWEWLWSRSRFFPPL